MSFSSLVLSMFYIVFLWSFTTGMIMTQYGRPTRVARFFFLCYTLAAVASLIGVRTSGESSNTISVYVAITCGVLLWGWQVAGYYLGFVTGPRSTLKTLTDTKAHPILSLKDRFVLAFSSGLYHEMFALSTGVLIALLTHDSVNRWAFWIYLTLWIMHGSSRLNVLLGVRNFKIEFLPSQFHYLKHLISEQKSNKFFPFSVLIPSLAVLALIFQAMNPQTTLLNSTGSVMVATMLVLGIFEHGLLMLPISKLQAPKLCSIELSADEQHPARSHYGKGR